MRKSGRKSNNNFMCKALLIGGSAGSLNVLLKILPGLNKDLGFPIIIVLHRKPGKDSILTDILSSKTLLHVKEVEEKEVIKNDTVYIAPPNYHLLFEENYTFALDASEKINFSRPSIDVSFESAAEVYNDKLTCLILSGANADGARGMVYAAEHGAQTWAQDPATAVVSVMPQSAIEIVKNIKIVQPEEISLLINALASNLESS